MKGGIKAVNNPVYKVTFYELLKSYSSIKTQSLYQTINIPKLASYDYTRGNKTNKK